MIVKTFSVAKDDKTNQATALAAMDLLDAYIMATFNNVTRVQKFHLVDNAYRYTYLIDSFENLYFSIENATSTSSSSIYVSLQKANQITKTTNVSSSSDYVAVMLANQSTMYSNVATIKANFIAYNGRLKAIAISDSTIIIQPWFFVNQTDGKYLISTGGASTSVNNGRDVFKDDIGASRYYLYQCGLYTYSPAETNALMRKAVIVGTSSTNYNSPLECLIEGVYNIVNSAFSGGVYTLIDIGGDKYRQICGQYLFIPDGDIEQ